MGILQESLDYTSSETPLIQAALAKQHIPYATAAFPATATDVTPEMAALKSAGADAMFVEALGPAAGYALTAGRSLAGTRHFWATPRSSPSMSPSSCPRATSETSSCSTIERHRPAPAIPDSSCSRPRKASCSVAWGETASIPRPRLGRDNGDL